MAAVLAILGTPTANSITYSVTEDGNAVGTVTRTILSDLVAGGLLDTLTGGALGHADQAAAQLVFQTQCLVEVYHQESNVTVPSTLEVNANVNAPAAANNFRLEVGALKTTATDTSVHILRISNRHTIDA